MFLNMATVHRHNVGFGAGQFLGAGSYDTSKVEKFWIPYISLANTIADKLRQNATKTYEEEAQIKALDIIDNYVASGDFKLKIYDKNIAFTLNAACGYPQGSLDEYIKADVQAVKSGKNPKGPPTIQSFLAEIPAPPPPLPPVAAPTKAFTTSTLNVRSMASAGATKLGSLKLGEEVLVNSTSGEWAQIDYKGKAGYCLAKFLTPANVSAPAIKTAVKTKSSVMATKSAKTLPGVLVASAQDVAETTVPDYTVPIIAGVGSIVIAGVAWWLWPKK